MPDETKKADYASTSPVAIDLASGRVLAPGEQVELDHPLDDHDRALVRAGTLYRVPDKPAEPKQSEVARQDVAAAKGKER
jgi:hypothetical protein